MLLNAWVVWARNRLAGPYANAQDRVRWQSWWTQVHQQPPRPAPGRASTTTTIPSDLDSFDAYSSAAGRG